MAQCRRNMIQTLLAVAALGAQGACVLAGSADLALQPATVQLDPPAAIYGDATRKFQGIPGIERADNGRLWATWYAGGEDEGPDNYTVLITSGDDGATWSDPVLVIDPDGPIRSFDPVLWLDPMGKLWLIWSQAHTWWDGRGGVWAITTDNPGEERPSWAEPRRLFHGVMMNKPTVLENGDWLAPAAVWNRDVEVGEGRRPISDPKAVAYQRDQMFSNVWRSRDHGATWELLGGADVPGRSFDEHMFVERNDGSLWVLVRTSRDGIGQSVSTDGGVTWSPGGPPHIDHISARFFIRRLDSGNLLLIRHDPPADNRKRSHLKAFVSNDDGETWTGGLLLDERFGVSYPDAVQAEDGTIYAIYDYDRKGEMKVYMAVFTEEDAAAGRMVSGKGRLRVVVNDAGAVDAE